jgi:uncharacterized membrane protein YGL010W
MPKPDWSDAAVANHIVQTWLSWDGGQYVPNGVMKSFSTLDSYFTGRKPSLRDRLVAYLKNRK